MVWDERSYGPSRGSFLGQVRVCPRRICLGQGRVDARGSNTNDDEGKGPLSSYKINMGTILDLEGQRQVISVLAIIEADSLVNPKEALLLEGKEKGVFDSRFGGDDSYKNSRSSPRGMIQ